MGRVILVTIAVMLFAAPAASAGTAHVDARVLRFEAAPGERNDVSMSVVAGELNLSDATGLTVAAGAGCIASAPAVRCPVAGFDSIVLDLGDEADRARTVVLAPIPMEINGGPGDDELDNGAGADRIDGGPGSDTLRAGGGADEYIGGFGLDTAMFAPRTGVQSISLDDVANDGFAGENDNVRSDVEEVYSGDGNDTLTGSDTSDSLNGGPGSDTIDGRGGSDSLDSGFACADNDHLVGGAGNDTLRFSRGALVEGGADDDTLVQVAINCPPATSDVSGGPGTDTADFSSLTRSDVQVSLDDAANDGPDDVHNFRSDIENLTAGNGGMVLIGSDGPNVIRGGNGDDILDGGAGTDTLRGGDGFDLADYSDHTAALILTLDGLANDGAPGEIDLIDTDIEDLAGGDGDDTLVGDDGDNILDGGRGADTIRGGGGTDTVDYSSRLDDLVADLDGATGDDGEPGEGDTLATDLEGVAGGDGDDILIGNDGNGFLVGNDGDDRITDRGGADIIDAGAGADEVDSVDDSTDGISCGDGADEVRADDIDAVSADCEVADDSGPTPGPDPTPLSPPSVPGLVPATPVFVTDRVAPTATLRVASRVKSRTMRSRGVTITLTCNELCRASFELKAASATARRVMARGTLRLGGPPTRRLRLKLNADGRRALRRVPTGRYVLTVRVSDVAGNVRTITRTLRFTR